MSLPLSVSTSAPMSRSVGKGVSRGAWLDHGLRTPGVRTALRNYLKSHLEPGRPLGFS